MPDPLLTARNINAGYGSQQILFGIDLDVRGGEAVVLLGANGSGKSTMLNTLSGFVRPWSGSLLFEREELAGKPAFQIFRRGIVQVSQGRDLFPDMSVEDNLRFGAAIRRGPVEQLLQHVFDRFPRLSERRRQMVRLMSGGEQQMVAIGRALMSQPRVLLLDEPSGGLAPSFVREIAAIIAGLRNAGVTMVLVEQNIKLALAVADRVLILRDGLVSERQDLVGSSVNEEEIVRKIYL